MIKETKKGVMLVGGIKKIYKEVFVTLIALADLSNMPREEFALCFMNSFLDYLRSEDGIHNQRQKNRAM